MHIIQRFLARPINLPLREPFETAKRRAVSSPTVIIELVAGDITGCGEATPVQYVTGEDITTVTRDIAIASEVLCGMSLSEYMLAARKLAEALPNAKTARAGVEIALFDAVSKSQGVPMYAFLGGTPMRIETDVTIPILPPQRARASAAELSARGFRIFKAKVGKDEDEDIARVMAISEGAPGCCFVLDANQGFQPAQAVEFIKNLLARGIKIRAFEQPVNAMDLDGMRFVTKNANVPVFADEAAQTPADVKEIARSKAATGINVKLMKCGMFGALEIVSICKKAGLDLMFGCMLESKIAQSAAVHIACGTGAFTVFDLDSDILLADQPIRGGAQRAGAMLNVSARQGLGCEIIESELNAFLEAD